jgi:hypothetical protein
VIKHGFINKSQRINAKVWNGNTCVPFLREVKSEVVVGKVTLALFWYSQVGIEERGVTINCTFQ